MPLRPSGLSVQAASPSKRVIRLVNLIILNNASRLRLNSLLSEKEFETVLSDVGEPPRQSLSCGSSSPG